MMANNDKAGTETRGRPKKEETRTLAPIYKQIFSDNSAIVHTTFLIYVFEVFIETKNQKRVGHKDGGFTIYDKLDSDYCFDDIQARLKDWEYLNLDANTNIKELVRILPALGPQLILREILKLIDTIVGLAESGRTEDQIFTQLKEEKTEQEIDSEYPHMRFVQNVLKELKLDKFEKQERASGIVQIIRQRVRYLWEPLLKILIHTVLNSMKGKVANKYFKPFFSDAENPHDTYIGQLNLDQIVAAVQKIDSRVELTDKPSKRQNAHRDQPMPISIDKMKKIRSIDLDGQRHIVQIIKAPKAETPLIQMPTPTFSRPFSMTESTLPKAGFTPTFSTLQLQKKAESEIVNVLKEAFKNEQDPSQGSKQLKEQEQDANNSPDNVKQESDEPSEKHSPSNGI